MEDSGHECQICHTEFEPIHTIVQPSCGHSFHAICIHVWMSNHTRCPICRSTLHLSTKLPIENIFAVALVLSREIALEQATYTYAFLSLFLKRFRTQRTWNQVRETLQVAREQFEVGMTRLPYLDLTSRTTAKKEKKKWANIFGELSEEETVRESQRIRSAKRWILDRLFFMFEE
jgi:hypothetical protein